MSSVEIFSHFVEIQGFTEPDSVQAVTRFDKWKLNNNFDQIMMAVSRDLQSQVTSRLSISDSHALHCCPAPGVVQTKYKQISQKYFLCQYKSGGGGEK